MTIRWESARHEGLPWRESGKLKHVGLPWEWESESWGVRIEESEGERASEKVTSVGIGFDEMEIAVGIVGAELSSKQQ